MPDLDELRQRMAHLWAKSPRPGAVGGYPLLQHLQDVCWQAAEFYRASRPAWPLADSACLPRVLAYASLLHDFGKAHRDFQRALRPPNPRFHNRHEVLSLAFLAWLRVGEAERIWLAAAIASHHKGLHQLFDPGGPFHVTPVFDSAFSKASHLAGGLDKQDVQHLRELLGCAPVIFQLSGWPGFEPYEMANEAAHPVVEILRQESMSISRFLARFSLKRSLRPGPQQPRDWASVIAAIHTRGVMINSDHLASFGRREIVTALRTVPELEQALGGRVKSFNSFQTAIASRNGSAVLVAPTGSGKTEAALLWAAAQTELGENTGRTLFLLPYQASMNAMQRRLIGDLFPGIKEDRLEWNSRVSLAHGRSVRRLYEALLDHDYGRFEATELASTQDELARLQAAPILVSSPFALIRLILTSRGAEGLWQGAYGARIILDEIHAFEPSVTAMVLASIRFLVDHLKATVLFITATLPAHLHGAIRKAIPDAELVSAADDIMGKPPRHCLRLLEIDSLSDEAFARIKTAASEKSVLVVVNQVRRAVRLYTRLRQDGLDASLLHSRFNNADRSRIENMLRPERGRILVATQAVEVSLDVSFGECFSELAPLESLQQRFGRCNRKGEIGEPAPVSVFCKCPSAKPYDAEHLRTVLGTLRNCIDERGEKLLTEGLMRDLLDRSYPDAMKSRLEARISKAFADITKHVVDEFVPYGPRDLLQQQELEKQWQELFDGEEVLPDTMLEQARSEPTWLGRSRYLVPIPSYAFGRIQAEWNEELMCFVAAANYSSETGIEFRSA